MPRRNESHPGAPLRIRSFALPALRRAGRTRASRPAVYPEAMTDTPVRPIHIVLILILLAVLGAIAWVWSITSTPFGRMDLIPAVVIKTMPSDEMQLTPERRQRANDWTARLISGDVPDSVEIRDLSFDAPKTRERLRLYVPEADPPLGVVVWIHGGGFWMGERLEDWDAQCAPLAAEAGVIVASVGYRLAPEHPFPAAVEDTWAGLLHVTRNAEAWGGDPNRIVVMGGSAGGNLAAVMAQRAVDEGGPKIALQVLTVPTLNAGGEPTASMIQFAEGYGLNGIDVMRGAYFSREGDVLHRWATPLLRENLEGLPPAVIHTAQFDPLRDEGERYAERLERAGVPVELRRFDGAIHGFLGSRGARAESARQIANAIRRAIGSEGADL